LISDKITYSILLFSISKSGKPLWLNNCSSLQWFWCRLQPDHVPSGWYDQLAHKFVWWLRTTSCKLDLMSRKSLPNPFIYGVSYVRLSVSSMDVILCGEIISRSFLLWSVFVCKLVGFLNGCYSLSLCMALIFCGSVESHIRGAYNYTQRSKLLNPCFSNFNIVGPRILSSPDMLITHFY
jgi:hypothetical protein